MTLGAHFGLQDFNIVKSNIRRVSICCAIGNQCCTALYKPGSDTFSCLGSVEFRVLRFWGIQKRGLRGCFVPNARV